MTRYILQPVEIAEELTLFETLLWMKHKIYFFNSEDPAEHFYHRFDPNSCDVLTGDYVDDLVPDDFSNTVHGSSDPLEQRKLRRKSNRLTDPFYRSLEAQKADLFAKLTSGALKARGDKYAPLENSNRTWKDEEFFDFEKEPVTVDIDANEWLMDGVDWFESELFTPDGLYTKITLDFDPVLELYPAADPVDIPFRVTYQGRHLIGESNEGLEDDPDILAKIQAAQIKRGRKPVYDWQEFHVQVGHYMMKNGLPDKQLVLVNEMQNWCKTHWGKAPAESEIKKRVSLYYNAEQSQADKSRAVG
ncbi:MAG: hypothetical protein H6861_08200 [Rhodospirillales bacterium]|nr:hypothetical protein [Rhodospirillales bacterium]